MEENGYVETIGHVIPPFLGQWQLSIRALSEAETAGLTWVYYSPFCDAEPGSIYRHPTAVFLVPLKYGLASIAQCI